MAGIPQLPADARERLRQHFLEKPTDSHPSGWDDLYEQDFTPWDRGSPNPALIETLSRKDLFDEPTVLSAKNTFSRRKRALVPGCGRGYDVLLLAAFGYDAYGLEYSPRAVQEAKKVQAKIEEALGPDGKVKEGGPEEAKVYETRSTAIGRGKIHWVTGDFFKNVWVKQVEEIEGGRYDGGFELIYDYTVCLCLTCPSTVLARHS